MFAVTDAKLSKCTPICYQFAAIKLTLPFKEESVCAVITAFLSPVIVPDRELAEERKPGASEPPRIRSPLCGLVAHQEDKWFCTCGNEWNTFDTGGVCPACLHQWTFTHCLSCSRWSPHSGWYASYKNGG